MIITLKFKNQTYRIIYDKMNIMEKYLVFLEYLMGSLNKYFKAQAPYIKCKEGCAKCCSNGNYPFSEIEVDLLKLGFNTLDTNTQEIILNNIRTIKEKKQLTGNEEFTYSCPFLINNKCSVYNFRGIICRTFGLIYMKEGEKMQIPFCAFDGLNYSNILDKESGMLTLEKMHEQGITIEPKAYNIHYSTLTSDLIAKEFGFDFGEKGSLIELLLKDDIFNK